MRERIRALLEALIDQHAASVVVAPYRDAPGFWFGGGSLARDADGTIWLSGRYRNYGDSRLGLEVGERGLECALYRSQDGGHTFEQVVLWSKADLSRQGAEVLSIEGTALYRRPDGMWELYISSEKAIGYPEPLRGYQKPGTGVWSIDRVIGPSPSALDLTTLTSALVNESRPAYLHLKDPVVYGVAGKTVMIFCSHPFCWSSTNSGFAVRPAGQEAFNVRRWEMVSRGPAWDVAATRITDRMSLPPVGVLADQGSHSVYFYDGAECLRSHSENPLAATRPRGYSCEELGGAFLGRDEAFPEMDRLSPLRPLFVSPWGTGCSRYVGALVTEQGVLAVWQQGQADGSQPLVGHSLSMEEVEQILR
jgi:hypothetical protein